LGEVVGNYRITAKLAEGGMGAVYRAEHPLLGKPAAVKVLLPELSNDRDLVSRFFTEARSATSVRHPGIVEIYDFGYLPSGAAYLIMELLDGEPLSAVLVARGRLTEQEALLYTRGIASALAAAHVQGIVHRDLKPDNIFLVRDPDMAGGLRPKILDFGIAKVAEAQRVGGATSKTRTGTVLGTPTYMSPEQCRGVGEIDHRSDLYSIGCILYEMLVGWPPFNSEGIGELLAMHQFMAPQAPGAAGVVVSGVAERIVLQLLQKRPEDRVQSAADLARMLGQGSLPPFAVSGAPPLAAAAVVGVPTTLSGAAGAALTGSTLAPGPRRSPRAFLLAGLGVILAGGAAAAVAFSGGGGGAAGAGGGASSSVAGAAAPSAPAPSPAPDPPPDASLSRTPIDAGVAAVVAPPSASAEIARSAPLVDAAPPIGAAAGMSAGPGKQNTMHRGTKQHVQPTKSPGGASVDRGD
jgi:serine/threonine-protein kinase